MKELFDPTGQVIVVTGGGGTLCGTIAKALAGAGGKVAVWDINGQAAVKVSDEIKSNDGISIALQCDVLDKQSLEAAREKTVAELGEIDVLINGVGGNKKQATTSEELSFFDLPEDAVRSVFDVNLMGAFFASQVVARDMAERRSGVIINISSMNAIRPLTKIVAYSAAKARSATLPSGLPYTCAEIIPRTFG